MNINEYKLFLDNISTDLNNSNSWSSGVPSLYVYKNIDIRVTGTGKLPALNSNRDLSKPVL